MTYEWNINNWIKTIIPAPIRKQVLVDFAISLLSPLNAVYLEFKETRDLLKKRIRFNGQVIVLENLLNDEFDITLRRIRIITTDDLLRKKYIGQPTENKPLWIAQPSENKPQYIGQWIEYQNMTGYHFTVEVPMSVYNQEELLKIKAKTNYYKLAGKRAKFIFQDGSEF